MAGAESIILVVKLWGLAGLAVACAFLTRGIQSIDPDARGAIGFRPLLVPGIMVLWPLVLWRWWVLATHKDDWRRRHDPPRRSHGLVALLLLVLLPLALVISYSLRQTWPDHIPPQPLSKLGTAQQ